MRVARVALLLRVSCQRAVALALPEPVVPWHLAEPSAAVELLVVAVQRVAAGHEVAGVLRVPSHLEQPAELGHSEPLEHLALLERSEPPGCWVPRKNLGRQEQQGP